eukprot:Clim_evm35s33 gene=Clim_evmTU35s33
MDGGDEETRAVSRVPHRVRQFFHDEHTDLELSVTKLRNSKLVTPHDEDILYGVQNGDTGAVALPNTVHGGSGSAKVFVEHKGPFKKHKSGQQHEGSAKHAFRRLTWSSPARNPSPKGARVLLAGATGGIAIPQEDISAESKGYEGKEAVVSYIYGKGFWFWGMSLYLLAGISVTCILSATQASSFAVYYADLGLPLQGLYYALSGTALVSSVDIVDLQMRRRLQGMESGGELRRGPQLPTILALFGALAVSLVSAKYDYAVAKENSTNSTAKTLSIIRAVFALFAWLVSVYADYRPGIGLSLVQQHVEVTDESLEVLTMRVYRWPAATFRGDAVQ